MPRRAPWSWRSAIVMFYTADRLVEPVKNLLLYLSALWVGWLAITIGPVWIVVAEAVLLGGFASRRAATRGLAEARRGSSTSWPSSPWRSRVIQILSVKAPDAVRPARQPEPMAQLVRPVDRSPARYLLHHPRWLRAARRDEVAFRLRQYRVPGAPGAQGFLCRAAQHGQLLPDSPLPLQSRSTPPTSTTWSRDWATTRPSWPT